VTYRILVLLAVLALALGASACGAATDALEAPADTAATDAPPDPTDVPPTEEPTDEPVACLPVSQDMVDLLAESLTITGGGGIGRAAAMSVEVSDADEGEWWLVAAELTGAGMDGTIAVWVTGGDPTIGASGPLFSADGIAAEFSEWGQPPDVARRFGMFDEDVRAVKGCLE
jgi:hypothetical protein